MLLETAITSLKKQYPLKLVAGAGGLNQDLTWFHIIESQIQSEFIHGNELVFTTGMNCRDESWLTDLVSRLHRHKACALVINLGPYIEAVPQEILDLCDDYQLPLFTVPWQIMLVDISRTLSKMILDHERLFLQTSEAMKSAVTASSPKDAKALLAEAGFALDCHYCLAALGGFKGAKANDDAVWAIHHILKIRGPEIVVFTLEGNLVIAYLNETESSLEKSLKFLLKELVKSYPKLQITCGISENLPGGGALANQLHQAKLALALALADQKPLVFFSQSGLMQILSAVSDKTVLENYANQVLGELINYDKAHNSDYAHWLKLYLDCDGSVQRVTEIAYCHRNTVNYKLKKLRELFRIDTGSHQKITQLSLAFAILKLLEIKQLS